MYGENDGIRDDIKVKIKNFGRDAELINLFETEIIKNKNILYENVINESLFNEKKIIFIQSASDKIFNEIVESLEINKKNIKIYIFSENLDKKSKLRNLFEKEKNLAALPCYKDNERTLVDYLSKELKGYAGLTGELINLIINNSNSNRKIIRSELVKIKSFFSAKKINKNDLLELLNIKSDTNFEKIRDNILIGEKGLVNKLLSEIEILEEDTFFYLNNLNYRVLKLIEMQKANELYKNYEKMLDYIKPQIFWKDKPMYLKQLKKWNLVNLNKAAHKISEAEILMKKNRFIKNQIVIKDLITTLSKEASTFF